MIGNHSVLAHHAGRRMFPATDIHADRHIAAKFRTLINQFRNTFCLIGCKSIHRIDNQCLDTAFTAVLIAIFQNRIEKAFGFTGTRTGRN